MTKYYVIIIHIDKILSTLPQVEEPTVTVPVSRLSSIPSGYSFRQSFLKLVTFLGIIAPSVDGYIKKCIETGNIESIGCIKRFFVKIQQNIFRRNFLKYYFCKFSEKSFSSY